MVGGSGGRGSDHRGEGGFTSPIRAWTPGTLALLWSFGIVFEAAVVLQLTEPRTRLPAGSPAWQESNRPARPLTDLADDSTFLAMLDSLGWQLTDEDSLITIRTPGGSSAVFDSANLRDVELSPAAEDSLSLIVRSVARGFGYMWIGVTLWLAILSAIPLGLVVVTVTWYRGRRTLDDP